MARRLPPGELLRRGAIGTLLATGVVALASPVLETVLEVSPSFEPLALERAASLTVLGGALAVGAYALVDRRAPEPRRTFLLVAALVLALSLIPDLLLLKAGDTVDPA